MEVALPVVSQVSQYLDKLRGELPARQSEIYHALLKLQREIETLREKAGGSFPNRHQTQ